MFNSKTVLAKYKQLKQISPYALLRYIISDLITYRKVQDRLH